VCATRGLYEKIQLFLGLVTGVPVIIWANVGVNGVVQPEGVVGKRFAVYGD
jgi:hypothetical protein